MRCIAQGVARNLHGGGPELLLVQYVLDGLLLHVLVEHEWVSVHLAQQDLHVFTGGLIEVDSHHISGVHPTQEEV